MSYSFKINKIMKYNPNTIRQMDISPIPQCSYDPKAGFYVEYDFIAEQYNTTNITQYTCGNGDNSFFYICEVNGTPIVEPTCLTSSGTGLYGLGYLEYEGSPGITYNITVNVLNIYVSTSYDATSHDHNINNYTIQAVGSNTVGIPGIQIYIDSNRNGEVKPGQGYGGKNSDFNDSPYFLSEVWKLGKSSGTTNDNIHCKIINDNSIDIRVQGSIYIIQD